MKYSSLTLFVAVAVSVTPPLPAAAPEPVSPGAPEDVLTIDSGCPTFSWGKDGAVESYEIAVYRIASRGEEAEMVLRQRLPGSASSWTPSLDSCLAPGGTYAWTVRAVSDEAGEPWSSPRLFRVHSAADDERMSAVAGGAAMDTATADGSTPDSVVTDDRQEDAGASIAPTAAAASAGPAAAEATQLTVDGGVVAGSFTGDGSTLTGLDPGELMAGTAAIDISGTAADASDLSCVDCISETELAFDPATQVELSAHASSGDHDGSYVNTTGDLMTGKLTLHPLVGDALETTAGVVIGGNVGFAGDLLQSGSLFAHRHGTRNTAVGATALSLVTSGQDNTAFGDSALGAATSGSSNTSVGSGALSSNTNGEYNTAIGAGALQANVGGAYSWEGRRNTALGWKALYANVNGSHNTAIGAEAMMATTGGQAPTGSLNTAVGKGALSANTSGGYNTAVGARALESSTTVGGQTAVGYRALRMNTDGQYNTAVGSSALRQNTTGSYNTAVGTVALFSGTSGDHNTAVGYRALGYGEVGSGNTALGSRALASVDASSPYFAATNTAVGAQALSSTVNGFGNTAVGWRAMYKNNQTSGYNVAVGLAALRENVSGWSNTAVGPEALISATSGYSNTALGSRAGYYVTGSHTISIGNEGLAGESNVIRIGTTHHQKTFIAGIRNVATTNPNAIAVYIDSLGQLGTVSSSRRFKRDIRDIGETSSALLDLRPVAFRHIRDSDQPEPESFGLIAEEVAEVFPELVVYNESGEPQTVRYNLLSSLLLNEVQRQNRHIRALEVGALALGLLAAMTIVGRRLHGR